MNILIFTGGKPSDKKNWEHYLLDSCFIIAADSGLDIIEKYNIRPDLIVGDMDSLTNSDLLDQYKEIVEHYPEEKDYSDTELALQKAKLMDHKKIILIGGGEGRLDHTLSIITTFESHHAPDIWMTECEIIYNVWGSFKFHTDSGSTISVYGLGVDGAFIDNSHGLKWSLKDMRLNREIMSLSNLSIKKEVEIIASKEENYLVIVNQ